MNAIEFSQRFVHFSKSSEITGPFNLRKYRMLGKPLLALDDIAKKETVIYKASGCMGTVFGQLAMAYRIARVQGDMLFVAQSDDDADNWSDTRGKSFLLSIDPVKRLVRSNEKYPITQRRWLFSHKFLIVTGPGVNAQNSDQVTFLQTDESHLYDAGVLAGFDGRIQSRGWLGNALHTTTAPNEGHDIDTRYKAGDQNEWHLRCLKCEELFWPLWRDQAKDEYNGTQVFQWKESQSETEMLDSIVARCPHCDYPHKDISITRNEMNDYGEYIAMNPDCDPLRASYRWNRFAASWLSWRDALSRFKLALKAARLGDLKPHEEFVKKDLCHTYRAELPDFGDGSQSLTSYQRGDVRIVNEPVKRFCSFDYQEGRGGEGIHWWGQVDEYTESGNVRAVSYAKLYSWSQCRAFQIDNNVSDPGAGDYPFVSCDFGHRDREVFLQCSRFKWLALKASDGEEPISFLHTITDKKTGKVTTLSLPYSEPKIESANGIKPTVTRIKTPLGATLAPGLCFSRTWSKASIGFLLCRMRSGTTGRTYEIPTDISQDFLSQINSYIEVIEPVKKGSLVNRRVLKKVRVDDHAFATSSQNLVLAIIAKYYPIAS